MSAKSKSRQKARSLYWGKHNKQSYECPDCGRHSDQLRTGFEVHHIDGNPKNNSLDNLVGLCRPCHNIRERKKPSFNELSLIQEQLEDTQSLTETTPVITEEAEVEELYTRYESINKPFFRIRQINRREYSQLKINFETARGWQVVERENTRNKNIYPQLTEEVVNIVNSIISKYRDKQTPQRYNGYWGTHYGDTFVTLPPLKKEVSLELASELRPLVMNESNWERP